jgi:hypothetical protein
MRLWQAAIVIMALSGLLLVAPGCASEQRSYGRDDNIESIERPAQPLEDEESFADKIGEVGVVLLLVGTVAAGILVPLLLL